jgi:hypothetical protein
LPAAAESLTVMTTACISFDTGGTRLTGAALTPAARSVTLERIITEKAKTCPR